MNYKADFNGHVTTDFDIKEIPTILRLLKFTAEEEASKALTIAAKVAEASLAVKDEINSPTPSQDTIN